ncbi:sugar nucleotide-binding protein [Haloflavibacter putidus]|uniref:sugar nucleotide-binding protein n=1 Tax=Haloflavibacter putidus TaxID=2576776 RepID=UPI001F3599F0|nr:sugar nucleotide-binding protein [Haloflavibacter putidus]
MGGSGFLGNAVYKELSGYFNIAATYCTPNSQFEENGDFYHWDMQTESILHLLENLKPDIIISCLRGNFELQLHAHFEIIHYLLKNRCKLLFLSGANVFDAFTNFPSYEYDKTFSVSIYGRFKIKIENALLRLPNHKYAILRLPMVFGAKSPRIKEIKQLYKVNEAIEVFPNVVTNATSVDKFTQQLHYIINRNKTGVFHLGSADLIHHQELIEEICQVLELEKPLLKKVYSSNNDRFLAILPKDNLLPPNLRVFITDVIQNCVTQKR